MEAFDTQTEIGFIGLGVMGEAMARRLIEAGYSLTVHNRSMARAEPLAALGAALAGTPRAVGERSRLVFLSLPETAHVDAVLFGRDGLADALAPGACVVDTSTISAAAARAFAKASFACATARSTRTSGLSASAKLATTLVR